MYDRLRSFSGYAIFHKPKDFLEACISYFDWAESHPLQEQQVFAHKGEITRTHVNKVRAFTKRGLATHIGVPLSRLDDYRKRTEPGWAEVMELVEQVIYTQKFENAAAGLLNSSLISRELGLADKREHTGAAGGPIQTEEVTARERIASRISGLAARAGESDDSGGDDG